MNEAAPKPVRLPELRPELQLLEGVPDPDGRPTWLIHDPIANRFIQIDAAVYEALRHWKDCSSAAELVARANASRIAVFDERSLAALVDFLYANQLTAVPKADGWRHFAGHKKKQQRSIAAHLVHNYLFFRIPLVRPQALLEKTLPAARVLWSRPARLAVVVLGLVGLYLASRQWETFLSTFPSFLTWEGAVVGVLALILVKTAHELGHAYTAVHFGCRVHSMGLALVVLAPMPYTDVTDSWRLRDRRQRLAIDAAGIIVELAIAVVALFFWAFLPDGTARSTAFVISTVSALSSLAINLNPFMRFDGYYLLSEVLGVENLQERAFALGRWKLRETVFGLGAACPENVPRGRLALLVAYSWLVWIYRVSLFVGIALLVYHYFFKVLGLVLFMVEIVYFVARPIAHELAVWFGMRRQILAARRVYFALAAAAGLTGLLCLPWSSKVEIAAVVETAELRAIHAVRSARVEAVHVKHGSTVKAGEPIITLSSSDILEELALAKISLEISLLQHGRRMVDMIDREGSLVLESTIAALRGKVAGLEKELKDLEIAAPFDGTVVDLNPEVHPGRWLGPRDQIAVVAGTAKIVARGYVAEADVARLSEGADAVFISEHPMRKKIRLRIDRVATAGASDIEIVDLASVFGGRIAVTTDDKRRLTPSSAQYLVNLSSTEPIGRNDLSVRGVVLANGQPESIVGRMWRQALAILVRESGV